LHLLAEPPGAHARDVSPFVWRSTSSFVFLLSGGSVARLGKLDINGAVASVELADIAQKVDSFQESVRWDMSLPHLVSVDVEVVRIAVELEEPMPFVPAIPDDLGPMFRFCVRAHITVPA
jgi:hypothetical protein